MTQKIVINTCFGGFGLSDAAVQRYAQIKGITLYSTPDHFGGSSFTTVPTDQVIDTGDGKWHDLSPKQKAAANAQHFSSRDIPRDDPALVQVVEELGEAANGSYASLKVVEIPDDVKWGIHDYDGMEHVEEQHRTWS